MFKKDARVLSGIVLGICMALAAAIIAVSCGGRLG
jgi:hypothetical protein